MLDNIASFSNNNHSIKTNFFKTKGNTKRSSKLKTRAKNLTNTRIERDTQILSSINMKSTKKQGPYLKAINLRNRSVSSKRAPRKRDKTPKTGTKTQKNLRNRRPSIPTAVSIIDRLVPKKTQITHDIVKWLQENDHPANTKVYIAGKNYKCIRRALEQRGWVRNENEKSLAFHLKFILKCAKIKHHKLNNT